MPTLQLLADSGSADGTGLVRAVKLGLGTVHEEITDVGPGHVIRYRVITDLFSCWCSVLLVLGVDLIAEAVPPLTG
jgi:hypothetical protein